MARGPFLCGDVLTPAKIKSSALDAGRLLQPAEVRQNERRKNHSRYLHRKNCRPPRLDLAIPDFVISRKTRMQGYHSMECIDGIDLSHLQCRERIPATVAWQLIAVSGSVTGGVVVCADDDDQFRSKLTSNFSEQIKLQFI